MFENYVKCACGHVYDRTHWTSCPNCHRYCLLGTRAASNREIADAKAGIVRRRVVHKGRL